MGATSEYGRAGFALYALDGGGKEELRRHLTVVLSVSTREEAQGLCMSYVQHADDGQVAFLILASEYSGSDDDSETTLAAQDAIAFDSFSGFGPLRLAWNRNKQTYSDTTGSEVPEVQ